MSEMNNDLISRKRLKNRIALAYYHNNGLTLGEVKEIIDNVPTAELQIKRPQGRWIKREEIFDDEGTPRLVWGCKDCGFSLKSIHDKRNYCPNCGADMRGDANEID